MSDATESIPMEKAAASPREPAVTQVSAWERVSFKFMRGLLRAHKAVWGLHGLYVTCRIFGTLEYLINHKRRRRVRRMLKAVYGRELLGRDRRRVIREHFMRQRCDKVFYLIFDLLTEEEFRSRFTIANQHLMDEGLARGKGVYTMLCHHGAHHVVGMLMASRGYRVAGIRDPHEGAVRRYVNELWERKHPDLPRAKVIFSGEFVRQIYRLFQDNYALGSALDATRRRDDRIKTVPVRIFGETRDFITGTLQIALRCKSVVLQGFIIADRDFCYRLDLRGPMTDADNDVETPELVAEVMQRYADNIAEYARKYPDHITRV